MRANKQPAQPLVLWGYDASPFVSLVKESLSELELPYKQVGTITKQRRICNVWLSCKIDRQKNDGVGLRSTRGSWLRFWEGGILHFMRLLI